MSGKQKHWISGIDSIRFFLALIVLLSHFQDPFVSLLKGSGNALFRVSGILINHLYCGVAAVIAFFVISGFVIHYPYRHQKNFDVVNFLLRRWLRIGIPLLVIGLIANYYGLFGKIPIWSLYCEIIYYTLYPLLFNIRTSWKLKTVMAFAISSIVIILLNKDNFLSLFYQKNINYNINYWHLGVSLTWLIGLPCWLLGVVLADNIDSFSFKVSTTEIYKYRILVYLSSIVILSLAAHWYVSCIFSLNIFALLLYVWLKKEIVYHRDHKAVTLLEYFGKFSYSLYICHELCFVLILSFLPYNYYTYIPYIILTMLMSYIAYLVVEYPAHKLAQRIPKNTRK